MNNVRGVQKRNATLRNLGINPGGDHHNAALPDGKSNENLSRQFYRAFSHPAK